MTQQASSSVLTDHEELLPGLPDAVVMHFVLPRLPWYTRPRMLTISKAWRAAFANPGLLEPRTRELYKPAGLFLIHEVLGDSSAQGAGISSCSYDYNYSFADDGTNMNASSSGHQDHRQNEELSMMVMMKSSPICARLSSQDSDDESTDIFLLRKYAIKMYDFHSQSWHRLPPIGTYPSEIPSRCSFVCMNGKLYVMGGVPDSTKEKESAEMHMLNVGSVRN